MTQIVDTAAGYALLLLNDAGLAITADNIMSITSAAGIKMDIMYAKIYTRIITENPQLLMGIIEHVERTTRNNASTHFWERPFACVEGDMKDFIFNRSTPAPTSQEIFEPYYRTHETPPLPLVPEIILHVLEYLPLEPKQYSTFGRVCIMFYIASNAFLDKSKVRLLHNYDHVTHQWPYEKFSMYQWRRMTVKQFPTIHPYANVSNWVRLYKRRATLVNKYTSDIIDHCPQMEFICPLKFEDLKTTTNSNVRFCNTCHKNVYRVETMTELKQLQREGKCASFRVEYEDDTDVDVMGGLGDYDWFGDTSW